MNNSLLKIIKEIPRNNNKSALELWNDNNFSKTKPKHYKDWYPIIINTNQDQIYATGTICNTLEITFSDMLLNILSAIPNILNHLSLNYLKQFNNTYISINIQSPLYQLKPMLYKKFENNLDKTNKIYLGKYMYIKEILIDIQKEKNKSKKYLVICKLYNNNSFNTKLINSILKHNIIKIDDICEKLIKYITTNILSTNFEYEIINNSNLINYKKWLINNPIKN